MRLGLLLSVAGLVALVVAPFGTRAKHWSWGVGLIVFASAGLLGAAGVLVSFIDGSVAGVLLGLVVILMPLRYLVALRRAPRTNRFETAVDLPIDPEAAFERVLTAVRQRRWELVLSDRTAGRIEAVATSRWFGFKDDVTIQLAGAIGRTRVEIASCSRVGRSDLGVNARRVQALIDELTAGREATANHRETE